jgi:hypothetical protein
VIGICEVCLKSPCDMRCPNAEMPPIVYFCSECKEAIYDGDEYYAIGEEEYCAECFGSFRNYAEFQYEWEE